MRQDGGEPWHLLNGECRLSSFAGSLFIAHEDGEFRELKLFDGTPMVFKLSGNWKGDGRKVERISNGHFIVVAPREWKRTGLPLVEPAECTDRGFMAHYFFRDRGNLVKDGDGFKEYGAILTRSGIALTGDRVFDDSEYGELFVGDVPRLSSFAGAVWARVGEEREDGWQGENFKPSERSLAEVLNGRQGRFFVRVYNDDIKLLDSGEFRYLRDLQEIQVDDSPYSEKTLLVPPSTGYSLAKVQFISSDGTAIQPNLDTGGTHVTVQSGGTLIVAPHPDGDRISCALQSGADRVDTVIKLPRIWWRMEQNGREADEWRDLPLAMTRQEFREHTVADAAIRLRLPLRVSSVKVVFDQELNRTYRPHKDRDDTETEISLSDFIDYDLIDKRLNEDALLNVQCGAEVMALIRVSADPVPTIKTFTSEPKLVKIGETATLRWNTQNTKSDDVLVSISDGVGLVESIGSMEVMPMETTTFTLRLKAHGVDDSKSVRMVVQNDRGGKMLTLHEVKIRLADVGWSSMAEETSFSVRDLQRYWAGECHTGEYKSSEIEIPFFCRCMSEYAIERSKYQRHAWSRRRKYQHRRAKPKRTMKEKRHPT